MISDMSRLLDDITARFPSFAIPLASLEANDVSDLRVMGELASHAVDLYETGDVQDVRRAFELTEQLMHSPLQEERDAAVIGFLETVQNVASHRTCGVDAFDQFLGPRSQAAWTELTEIWQGKTSLAEVVAAETGATLHRRWWQFWKRRGRTPPGDLLKDVQNPELRRIIEQITRE